MITLKGAPFAEEEVLHIVRNLRPRDQAEIYALRWDNDPGRLAIEILAYAGAMWRMFCYEAEPVAMAGVVPVRPGVVLAGAFGTELWPHVVRPVTRFARDWSIPRLRNAHYHRAETYALARNVDSRKWLASLGAVEEAYLRGFGRDQEDFILYAWRLQDVHGRRPPILGAEPYASD
jgi:RimJ/RimL family protein N-acetyltransferase